MVQLDAVLLTEVLIQVDLGVVKLIIVRIANGNFRHDAVKVGRVADETAGIEESLIQLLQNFFAANDVAVNKDLTPRAGALVQWLWDETHVPKAVVSNPSTIYCLDIFTYTCCKVVMTKNK